MSEFTDDMWADEDDLVDNDEDVEMTMHARRQWRAIQDFKDVPVKKPKQIPRMPTSSKRWEGL